MSRGKHSYVRFFPSDWLAGTSRMTRVHRSVYFDICVYNWDKGEACPQSELSLMLMDLDNGSAIVAQLIAAGKLRQDGTGVWSPRAMEEADHAIDMWERRSKGGRAFRPSVQRGVGKTVPKTVPTLLVSNNQNQNQNQIEKEPSVPKKPTDLGTRLPSDWVIPDDWGRWASEAMGWSKREALAEADAFKDYWLAKAGKDARKLDWNATWRNWCRNSRRQKGIGHI